MMGDKVERKKREKWKVPLYSFWSSNMLCRSRAGPFQEEYHKLIKQRYIEENPGKDSYPGLGGIFP